jgi:methyl-accepting chemotaxis protein
MARNVTFGQKIGLGFAASVAMTLVIGLVGVRALQDVVASKDRVIEVDVRLLVWANKLEVAVEEKHAASRGFLLSREEKFRDEMRVARDAFAEALERLKELAYTPEGERLLVIIERAEADHEAGLQGLLARLGGAATPAEIGDLWETTMASRRAVLNGKIDEFTTREERLLEEAERASTAIATKAINLVLAMAAAALVLAAALAFVLTRSLGRQVGTAVGQVQSSSAELQAAANQQATGAREQATAMSEIATTISELLTTSRQIAESAQRVAHIAQEAAAGARVGEGTVGKAHESISGIRQQVDLVVNHMLELGKKSQQIGSVLEIVSELAEQTNILAVNATIEAAGAGDAGKRFAIVADEIRKLADRVAGSAKEIRGLIDDVRGAVNTTVMATEGGSKAVDSGTRQFGEVSTSFKEIATLLSTTEAAAREIELSTKQQASAVEQVNVAIANVAQTTRETEASSSQTLQTASQLTGLSRDLVRLIRSHEAA